MYERLEIDLKPRNQELQVVAQGISRAPRSRQHCHPGALLPHNSFIVLFHIKIGEAAIFRDYF